MTFDEAIATVKAGRRVRRAGWARADSCDFNHLVGRDRVASRRRTQAEIYLVEVYPSPDVAGSGVAGSGIVGVMPYNATDSDRLADDWQPFELPDEWDLDHGIDFPS